MTVFNIFVSFEFGKDNNLKNAFYTQAKDLSQYRIKNHSLNEPYREEIWKDKARKAIHECDVVFVLVGQDTHNAPGVVVETDMALSLKKPTVQILSRNARRNNYKGIKKIEDRISWRWETIDRSLSQLANVRSRRGPSAMIGRRPAVAAWGRFGF